MTTESIQNIEFFWDISWCWMGNNY